MNLLIILGIKLGDFSVLKWFHMSRDLSVLQNHVSKNKNIVYYLFFFQVFCSSTIPLHTQKFDPPKSVSGFLHLFIRTAEAINDQLFQPLKFFSI